MNGQTHDDDPKIICPRCEKEITEDQLMSLNVHLAPEHTACGEALNDVRDAELGAAHDRAAAGDSFARYKEAESQFGRAAVSAMLDSGATPEEIWQAARADRHDPQPAGTPLEAERYPREPGARIRQRYQRASAEVRALVDAHTHAAKSPRCYDCGGLHPAGDPECTYPKLVLAASRAAGELMPIELASLGWFATHCREMAPGAFGVIAGLFKRAATRIEARFADLEELKAAIAVAQAEVEARSDRNVRGAVAAAVVKLKAELSDVPRSGAEWSIVGDLERIGAGLDDTGARVQVRRRRGAVMKGAHGPWPGTVWLVTASFGVDGHQTIGIAATRDLALSMAAEYRACDYRAERWAVETEDPDGAITWVHGIADALSIEPWPVEHYQGEKAMLDLVLGRGSHGDEK